MILSGQVSPAPPVGDSKSDKRNGEPCANATPQGDSLRTETQIFAERTQLQSWALNPAHGVWDEMLF